jgi:hypothetical protein
VNFEADLSIDLHGHRLPIQRRGLESPTAHGLHSLFVQTFAQ